MADTRRAPPWPVFIGLGLVVTWLLLGLFLPRDDQERLHDWLASTVPLLWQTKLGLLICIGVVVGVVWRLATRKR